MGANQEMMSHEYQHGHIMVLVSCRPHNPSPILFLIPPLMPQIYTQPSPSQSVNSFSDGEEEDNNIFASSELVVPSPATWYSRLHHVQRSAYIPPHSPASHLPPEILINILKHLSSPRDIHSTLLASRLWCECSVELLWHKPTVPDFNTLIKIMQVLSREEPTFTYAQFIRRLNFISVGSEMTDSIFGRLAPCTRLERLTLVGCSNLSDDVIARTVPSFPNLVAIDLSGVDSVTDRTVSAIAYNCRKLQGINLLSCRQVSSTSVSALAEKCPLLRRVKLSGLIDLTDEPVSALAIEGTLLLEIDLNGCKKLSDRAVRDIWTHSHNMREMRISHCAELTDLAFPAPQNIRDLPPGPNPFPESNRHPGSDLPPLRLSRPLEHLRMLDLTNCSRITDDAVEGIVSAAPRLRNLVLSKCGQLTDRAIESICLLGKHLHYLHLGHASSITDRSVKTLARSCTRLRYIDLASKQIFLRIVRN
jgi:F-box and leucine-rich repeat protein GRR1